MENYLHHIKTLADSLAAIQSPVSNLELIQFTTFGMPPDYHTFVITYSMLPGSYTFDDLQSKLIFYEQHLKFQQNCDVPVHQALVSTVSSSDNNSGGSSRNQTHNSKGENNGGCRNWNNKGHNNKGGNKPSNNNNNNSRQTDSSTGSMSTGIVYGSSDVSLSSTFCPPLCILITCL